MTPSAGWRWPPARAPASPSSASGSTTSAPPAARRTLTPTPDLRDRRAGRGEAAHPPLPRSEAYWLGVLSGRFSVWSVQLAGRQYSPLHEAALTRQVGFMLQSFALKKRG